MRKIAVSLNKGGVGKSTTALSIAHALALAGRKVLLVDTDSQGHISKMLQLPEHQGLAELISGDASPEEAIVNARDNLSVLLGDRKLAGVKREIARRDFGSEKILSQALAAYDRQYDFAILDTPPAWDTMTVNALFYSQDILAPVSLEPLSLYGLLDFAANVKAIQRHHKIRLRYIVPTFMDRRVKKSEEIYSQLQAHFGSIVCDPIRYNVRLSECAAHGQTIFEYAPKSNGANDFKQLARRILKNV